MPVDLEKLKRLIKDWPPAKQAEALKRAQNLNAGGPAMAMASPPGASVSRYEGEIGVPPPPLPLRAMKAVTPIVGMGVGGAYGGPFGAGAGLEASKEANAALSRAYGYPAQSDFTSGKGLVRAAGTTAEGTLTDLIGGRLLPAAMRKMLGLGAAETAGKEAVGEAEAKAEGAALKARTSAREKLGKGSQTEFRKLKDQGVTEFARQQTAGSKAADVAEQERQINQLYQSMGMQPGGAKRLAEAPTTVEMKEGKTAIRGVRNAARQELGRGFNAIFGEIQDQPIEMGTREEIGGHVEDVLQEAHTKGQVLAPRTQAILREIKHIAPEKVSDETKGGSLPMMDEEVAGLLASKGKHVIDTPEGPKQTADAVNLSRIRGLNSNALKEAEQAPDEINRAALLRASQPLRDVLDDAVPDDLKPELQRLKDEYFQLNRQMPWRKFRALNQTSSIAELGRSIFDPNKPDRALRIIAEAKSRNDIKGLDLLRRSYASSVIYDGGNSVAGLKRALNGREGALQELFGAGSPFSKPSQMLAMQKQRLTLLEQLQRDPGARAQYEQGIKEGMQQYLKRPDVQKLLRERQTQAQRIAPDTARAAEVKSLQGQAGPSGFARYMQHRITFDMIAMGAGAGGMIAHNPDMAIVAGAYLLKKQAWAAAMSSPKFASAYRDFLFSPNAQMAGRAAAKLLSSGVTDVAGGGEPSMAPPEPPLPEMHVEGP